MRGNLSLYTHLRTYLSIISSIFQEIGPGWLATYYLTYLLDYLIQVVANYFSHLWYVNRFYRKPKNGTCLKNVSILDRGMVSHFC